MIIKTKLGEDILKGGEKRIAFAVNTEGVTFYALVCHSLSDGWQNQTETIKKCFDSIEGAEPVASISIGTGLIGILSGAKWEDIKKGMELSKTEIILY